MFEIVHFTLLKIGTEMREGGLLLDPYLTRLDSFDLVYYGAAWSYESNSCISPYFEKPLTSSCSVAKVFSQRDVA